MNPNPNRNLERFVANAVQGLPARRAPSSLEQRVQAEIARRAALPWWRKSFLSWPLAARTAFVIVCAVIVRFAFMASGSPSTATAAAQVKTSLAPEMMWLHVMRVVGETIVNSVQAIAATIPSLWLYGGAAVIVALYLALFGLGAAAYRTLYASR